MAGQGRASAPQSARVHACVRLRTGRSPRPALPLPAAIAPQAGRAPLTHPHPAAERAHRPAARPQPQRRAHLVPHAFARPLATCAAAAARPPRSRGPRGGLARTPAGSGRSAPSRARRQALGRARAGLTTSKQRTQFMKRFGTGPFDGQQCHTELSTSGRGCPGGGGGGGAPSARAERSAVGAAGRAAPWPTVRVRGARARAGWAPGGAPAVRASASLCCADPRAAPSARPPRRRARRASAAGRLFPRGDAAEAANVGLRHHVGAQGQQGACVRRVRRAEAGAGRHRGPSRCPGGAWGLCGGCGPAWWGAAGPVIDCQESGLGPKSTP